MTSRIRSQIGPHTLNLMVALALAVAMLGAASPALAATGPICYVDDDATPPGDGDGWGTAFADLQSALGDSNCTEIWVAEGVYKPGALESDSFEMPPDVEVYGGFAGGETDFSERDPQAHVTILSGDIDDDDDSSNADGNFIDESAADISGNNSEHVVFIDGTSTAVTYTTVLDGFTITGGDANGVGFAGGGGGLFCDGTGGTCSPTLSKLTFIGNQAAVQGGAINNRGITGESSPIVSDVSFIGNRCGGNGGALYNYGESGISSPWLRWVSFVNNSSGANGGAIYNNGTTGESSPGLSNVTFQGNHADSGGGAMVNWGLSGESSPIVVNVTFANNTANGNGGAMFNSGEIGGASAPQLTNVILWGDSAGGNGDEMYDATSASVAISYSVVENGESGIYDVPSDPYTSGVGNVADDPMLGPLSYRGGYGQVLPLLPGSSALDNGLGAAMCPLDDQRRISRPRGLGCDRGAFERLLTPTDFDLDQTTDPAKYVPAAGTLWFLQSSKATWLGLYIGDDGEYAPNSDFDGDLHTDPTKYVAAAGAVWYFQSSDATWYGVYIGDDGQNIPASDFDGDGITDPAKYVAAGGAVWYLGSADATWYGVYIGDLGGGQYVPGSDFDGDGLTDPAYIDAGGNVWYLGSEDSVLHGLFIGADGPYIPRSDFDGDGVTDPAKFVSPYIWYLASGDSNTLTAIDLGADTTFVVPGSDFDGDGITDPAKFVSAAGAIWYQESGNSYNPVGVYMGDPVADPYDIVN